MGNQHGTTAGWGINTALRQDGESKRHYRRRGVNTALRQDGESITNFSLPFTNAFGNVINCFEISGLLVNVVKAPVLLEYDALSLGE